MAYFIFTSSNTQTPFAIINEQTMDTTSSSINIVGKRRVDYGKSQQQNQIWMLENFAAPNPPQNPIAGQLWYDTNTPEMKVFDGAVWTRLTNVYSKASAPSNPSLGQFWFNTDTNELFIWSGGQWFFIGPTPDPIPYAIVFGS